MRSAKSTETSRRSVAGSGTEAAGAGEAGTATGVVAAVTASPQIPQNLWPAGTASPQAGHPDSTGLPHRPQNRWPAGTFARQLGHGLMPKTLVPSGEF